MSRRGTALVATLWILTAISVLAAGGLAAARRGSGTSANRIALRRAAWAREACTAILLGRYDPARPLAGLDSVPLGGDTWCLAQVHDPQALLNVRLADEATLARALGDAALTAALLDWQDADDAARPLGAEAAWYRAHGRAVPRNGPVADLAELALVRGFERADPELLTRRFTVRGTGRVHLLLAPGPVLAALPWFTSSDIARLLQRRAVLPIPGSVPDVLAALGSERLAQLQPVMPALLAALTVRSDELAAEVEGHVRGAAVVARARLTLVPLPDRLAVTRREVE